MASRQLRVRGVVTHHSPLPHVIGDQPTGQEQTASLPRRLALVTAFMQFSCWKCAQLIDLPPASRVGSRDTCPRCDRDLHSCRNCNFYDPSKHNQCSEPQAEWVRDKEAANYCDFYRPNPVLSAKSSPPSSDAKKKFDSLFKI